MQARRGAGNGRVAWDHFNADGRTTTGSFGAALLDTAAAGARPRGRLAPDQSRKLLSVDVDGLAENGFRAEAWLRIFEELRFGMGAVDAHVNRRGKGLVANDNDDFLLVINLDHTLCVQHRGRELQLGAGDAVLLDCAETSTFVRPVAGYLRCVRMARRPVGDGTTAANDRSARVISRHSANLGFLVSYLDAVDRHYSYESPALRQRITAHVYDLAALLFDAQATRATPPSSAG